MKETLIQVNQKPLANVDSDVPGYVDGEQLYKPERTGISEVLFHEEAQERLWNSALDRVVFAATGEGERPFVHFPNAEYIQHFPFPTTSWNIYGDMESEHARLMFMLSKHSERYFPLEYFSLDKDDFQHGDIFEQWSEQCTSREERKAQIYQEGVMAMSEQRVAEPTYYHNGRSGAYQTKPDLYQTDVTEGKRQQVILEGICDQLSRELRRDNSENVSHFLDIYSHIKDPVTPITSTLSNQSQIFQDLYNKAINMMGELEPATKIMPRNLLLQVALESSFLALPKASEIACVIRENPHELPYIYVDITKLPRGEFANPQRTLAVAKEIITDSQEHSEAVVTPITVSHLQEPGKEADLFIVDGNNRATALLLLQYLDEVKKYTPDIYDYTSIHRFVTKHTLDIEWERDLVRSLEEMRRSKDEEILLADRDLLHQIASSDIPALLVQEPNFHTVAVQLSNTSPVLLQPWHQVAYNQRAVPFAIPSKQQSHGRVAGNNVRMSLRRRNYE